MNILVFEQVDHLFFFRYTKFTLLLFDGYTHPFFQMNKDLVNS